MLLYGLFFVGEAARVAPGGIDSLRSPCGQPVRYALSLSNWLPPVVEPQSGVLIPPFSENIKEKSPYFRTSSHLKYGGEGGIRTPDTLPYTHFPGVLLQPLGHLTILSSRCCGTGANVRKSRTNVNSLFQLIRPFSQTSNNMIPKCAESGFFINNAVC